MKKILQKLLMVPLLWGILYGCSANRGWFSTPPSSAGIPQLTATPVAHCSPMLGWLGGICTLGGMALLVISGGKMGWRPLIGGVLFVILNYALALYASWFFLPVVIATGAISLAWAGKIVMKILKEKSNGRNI